MLIVAITTSWAGTNPDYESSDWASSEEIDAALGEHDGVTVTVTTSGSDGNVSGHYYRPLNSAIDGAGGTYLQVSSAQQIEKVDIFFCPNGTSNTNLAWAAWGKNVTPSAEVGTNYGTTADYKASKSWDNATWQSIDLSSIEAYTVRISRQGKNLTNGGTKISSFGDNQTVNVLGIRVYLVSGTTHTVTYNLGDATAGTAPTQDAVAEGSKFTVADAPTDLVAPEGKDFKCWNDGTDDYSEGDKYTMGTSDVILTAVYADKYAVSYAAGEGTGSMDGDEVAEGKKITLPASTFTAPEGKTFKNWLCSADNTTYDAGAEYTMTAEATTFTAQYARLKAVYSLVDGIGSAEVEAADATVNEGESLVLTNTAGRIKISAADGQTFKAGDFITFTARIGNGTKKCGIKYGATTSLGTNLYVDGDGNNPSTSDYVVSGTLSLSADASDIYIGRYDGTTTTLTSLVISRIMETETITIPADEVATYVTQNALDFSSQNGAFKAYTVTAVSNTSATTAEVTVVPAGTALLLKGAAGSYDVEVAESADPVSNLLKASNGSVTGGDDIFAYSKTNKKFMKVATTVTIPAGKAYLQADLETESLDIDFEQATAVEAVAEANAETVAPVKVIKNGKLYIGNFNVAGQQVK